MEERNGYASTRPPTIEVQFLELFNAFVWIVVFLFYFNRGIIWIKILTKKNQQYRVTEYFWLEFTAKGLGLVHIHRFCIVSVPSCCSGALSVGPSRPTAPSWGACPTKGVPPGGPRAEFNPFFSGLF